MSEKIENDASVSISTAQLQKLAFKMNRYNCVVNVLGDSPDAIPFVNVLNTLQQVVDDLSLPVALDLDTDCYVITL